MPKYIPIPADIHKQLLNHWMRDAADPQVLNSVTAERTHELQSRYPDVFSLRPNGAFNLAVDQYLAHIGESVPAIPRKYILEMASAPRDGQKNPPFSYLSWENL